MMTRFALLLAVLGLTCAPPASAGNIASCRVDGLLPDKTCTPGDVATHSTAVVCGSSTRTRRHVSEEMHKRVFREYGLPGTHSPGAYEVDHLIPLELGGSNALANLWPEASPGFHDKDKVEDYLHERVCRGQMPLEQAQREIATNWTEIAVR